ncbi:zinc-ribbon domain-containing protein [Cetobacterium sp. SF1]|uniref:YfgJ family double zinc ribbon protein n=1 Tax=unclassified Cetobacterium TaxID=2630983 RepID=UPI003CEC308D
MEIKMILDFVCPYCFLGEKILEQGINTTEINVNFKFLPYELAPKTVPQSTVTEATKEYFEKNILTWSKKVNIPINFPTINPKPRTDLAFQGLFYAQEENKALEYVRAILHAYWIENKNIGSIEIISEIAEDINLSKDKMQNILENKIFEKQQEKLNDEVSQFDFEVVPTFYIDEKQLETFPRTVEEWIEIFKTYTGDTSEYEKVAYCPICNNKTKKLAACGSLSYWCDSCNELKSKQSLIYKYEKK